MSLIGVLDKHVKLALAAEKADPGHVIQGWAIAVAGTKRVSYVPFGGTEPTYNEEEAAVLNKKDAAILMSTYFERDRALWRFMRLIPVRGDKERVKGGMLPTINGC